MNKTHTLVISDVHLELGSCQAKLLLKTLRDFDYERLILLGDLYEHNGYIGNEQFEVIEYLREKTEKLVYIDGNHDPSSKQLVNALLGVEVLKKYEWQLAGKKFCAVHGHQFDRLLLTYSEPLVDKALLSVFLLLQKIDADKRHVGRLLNGFQNWTCRHVARRARKYAKKYCADVVLCGHTHRPEHLVFPARKRKKRIDYFNCGCWVENICSFVAISQDGEPELYAVSTK
jgi:UDP-2,3-diacylglucosamine pyrophosphatase LpxH